jgi:hypothetical protein
MHEEDDACVVSSNHMLTYVCRRVGNYSNTRQIKIVQPVRKWVGSHVPFLLLIFCFDFSIFFLCFNISHLLLMYDTNKLLCIKNVMNKLCVSFSKTFNNKTYMYKLL